MDQLVCSACQTIIPPDSNFCSKCGAKVTNIVLSVSIGKQIGIYALSFFLPPLGLWPGIIYSRQKNIESRRVGIIALTLTLISIIFSLWFGLRVYQQFMQVYSTQLNQYSTSGL